MNTLEQFVANDLGTIVANQSIKIARLQKENLELRAQLAEYERKGKKVNKIESTSHNTRNR